MIRYEQRGDGMCHCADCGATWKPFSTIEEHRCPPNTVSRLHTGTDRVMVERRGEEIRVIVVLPRGGA